MSSSSPHVELLILRTSPQSPSSTLPGTLLPSLAALINTSYAPKHFLFWPKTSPRIRYPEELLHSWPVPPECEHEEGEGKWERLIFILHAGAAGGDAGVRAMDVDGMEKGIGSVFGTATVVSKIDDEDGNETARKMWFLGMFAVDPKVQGMGLGGRLLRAVEDFIASRPARKGREMVLQLDAIREMGNDVYYMRNGYEVVWERWTEAGAWGCDKPFWLVGLEKVVKCPEK